MEVKDQIIGSVVSTLLFSDAKKVTKFLSPKLRITATRSHKRDRRNTRESFIVTIGQPNYEQRQLVKAAIAAKEPFPIRKLQIKQWRVKQA